MELKVHNIKGKETDKKVKLNKSRSEERRVGKECER